jgi:hypothetical protein
MLSKYHAVFLPAGTVLLLALHRPLRHWLAKPGPYLAVALGLLVFSPVILWNATHGWVSFLFQGGRAVGGLVLRPDYLATALVAQIGYAFPWIWIPLVLLLVRGSRNWSRLDSLHDRLGLCLAIVPVGVFTAVACFRPVLPHWGLIGLVSLFPALGRLWHEKALERPDSTRRWLAAGAMFTVLLLGVTLIEYRTGLLQRGGDVEWGLVDARTDPTADLYGWDKVALELELRGILDDPDSFLFTRTWYQSAQVAHAIRMKRPVLCYNIDDPRGFAFWSKPAEWVGRNGIYLMINEEFVPASFYRRWFRDERPLAEFWIERGGRPFRHVRAIQFRDQLAAFPFDFSPGRTAAREVIRAGGHPMDSPPRTARGEGGGGKIAR